MKKFLAWLQGFLNSLNNPVSVDQYMGLLRQLIPLLGGMAVALGLVPADAMNAQVQKILAFMGPFMIVIGTIWSLIANNKSSIIKAAAKMPETSVSADGTSIKVNDPSLAKDAKAANGS